MGFFPLDFKKVIIICLLVAVPLIAINVQRKEGVLDIATKPFFIAAGFIQNIYSSYSHSIKKTTGLYINLIDIKKDNQELTEKMKQIESELSQFKELQKENLRLTDLLKFKEESSHSLVAARVIGHDLLGQHSTLFINVGSDEKIQPGQAVITPNGVVGSVLNVEKNFSQILTLTDRYSAIDVAVERSRARAIIEGVSPTKCRLKYLQRTDDVVIGDIVVTTGLDKIFPRGFPVGKVIKVDKKDYGITQEVQVEPLVITNDIDLVFVVSKTNDKIEIENKILEMSKKD